MNDESIVDGLIEKIEYGCDIGRVGFLKEYPIQDDFYEGWKEKLQTLPFFYQNGRTISELLGKSPLKYQQEITTVLQYIADENGFTALSQIYDNENKNFVVKEFVDCIKDQALFTKVSKYVRASFKKVAVELRDCVNNFKSGQLLTDRDDIFRNRFKWIIALSECYYKHNLLHFDHCFEFDQFRINTDICLEVDCSSCFHIRIWMMPLIQKSLTKW